MHRLAQKKHVVGMKQCHRVIRDGQASVAYIANDGETRLVLPIKTACKVNNVQIVEVDSMSELGKACNITVGAIVAVILKD